MYTNVHWTEMQVPLKANHRESDPLPSSCGTVGYVKVFGYLVSSYLRLGNSVVYIIKQNINVVFRCPNIHIPLWKLRPSIHKRP